MAVQASVRIAIADSEALEELESAMTAGELDAVVVEIPDDSSALLNAREFRQLMRVAQSNGVELEIATDDPLRRELASILGAPMHARAHVAPRPQPQPQPEPQSPTTRTPLAQPAPNPDDDLTRRIQAPLMGPRVVAPDDTANSDDPADVSEASFSFVLTPPTPRRVALPPVADDAEFDVKVQRAPSGRAPTLRRTRVRMLTFMALLGALLGVAAFLVALLAPTATVTLVPAVAPISVDLTYGVAAPGANYDLAVDPRTLETTLTYAATLPTTGERFEPDAAARGGLLLTNPTTAEVAIAAGTVFTTAGGQEFVTTEDVVVPAADPFGSMTFGSVITEIVAQAPGPDGNVDADTLNGQLDSGVFYSNREALSGGSVKRIATVAQADLDALRATATADLQGKVDAALTPKLQPGEQLLDGSVKPGVPSVTFDQQVGADAPSVAVNATLNVSGQAYDPDAMQAQARDAIGKRLAAAVGAGTVVLADTVAVGGPQTVVGSASPAFRMHATASTRAVIDAATLASLKRNLAGASRATVDARLAALPGVARYSVEYGPSWLPERMPRLGSKMTIRVTDDAGAATATTSSASDASSRP